MGTESTVYSKNAYNKGPKNKNPSSVLIPSLKNGSGHISAHPIVYTYNRSIFFFRELYVNKGYFKIQIRGTNTSFIHNDNIV